MRLASDSETLAFDKIEPRSSETHIGDKRFAAQLNDLIALRQFLVSERIALKTDGDQSSSLEELNLLTYKKGSRPATVDEWRLLDHKSSVVNSQLDDRLRRKLKIKELGLFFGILPVVFLIWTILAIVGFIILNAFWQDDNSIPRSVVVLSCFVSWAISQGGLGACAFIGTRLIARTVSADKSASSQENARSDVENLDVESADLTDRNYLRMRVILGCLFAFLLCFNTSRVVMSKIIDEFNQDKEPSFNVNDLTVLMAPFIVGFSTSLVLAVMNRFVSAIQTFLGATSKGHDK